MAISLRSDWRSVLQRAWSVRLMLVSATLSGTATGLTIAQPYLGVNPLSVAAIVGIATTVASLIGIYARLVKQQGL